MSKAAGAFRTISEVSRELDVPQHVLRFWESKFTQVSPLKRGGGRRYYRPEDIRLLERIRDLLYVDGFTIKGVQKLIKEQGVKALLEPPAENAGPVANAPSPAPQPAAVAKDERRAIMTAIAELSEIRKLLTVSTS
ncbi:MAG: MerR family transcriptional regulator [Rickettsiales bacterium]